MQRLDSGQVEMLMQIVSNHYPNQQIFHLSDGRNDLHEYLFELTKARGYEYDLRILGEPFGYKFDPETHPGCTIEALDLGRKAFNKHARLYEYAFITVEDDLIEGDFPTFLQKIYRMMKNSGTVILFPKKGGSLQGDIDMMLEEGYFVAINHIDLFDRYDIVNARKMHGWHR